MIKQALGLRRKDFLNNSKRSASDTIRLFVFGAYLLVS